MTDLRWVQMSRDEMSTFLETGGTGVMSFTTDTDEPPLALPVSYGYYSDESQFYFRLSVTPGGAKTKHLERPVSFVVHDHTDEGWRSVIATGTLEPVSESPYESMTVQGMWAVDIPPVDIFDRPRDEQTFRDFRLDPTRLSGRKEFTS